MRQIRKNAEPAGFVAWKNQNRALPTFCYGSIPGPEKVAVQASLIAEQRGVCAYTGERIHSDACHIEHLRPQQHCVTGEDVSYANLVACVPGPGKRLPYGAQKKNNWPSPSEEALFVSPLAAACATRFKYKLNGRVEPTLIGDAAALETIKRLGLDNPMLANLRRGAIDGTLGLKHPRAALSLRNSRQRLRGLQLAEQNSPTLEPFSFVLIQALEQNIRRVEKIREGKQRR